MMKALVKRQPRSGLWLKEVPVPEIGLPVPPTIGHELKDEVVAVGSIVPAFVSGDVGSGEFTSPAAVAATARPAAHSRDELERVAAACKSVRDGVMYG